MNERPWPEDAPAIPQINPVNNSSSQAELDRVWGTVNQLIQAFNDLQYYTGATNKRPNSSKSQQTQKPPQTPKQQSSSSGGSGSVYPGQVISGSGTTYVVAIYKNGLSKAATNVSVKQLQLDGDEVIPAGTWALVAKSGTGYVMQVPVWL